MKDDLPYRPLNINFNLYTEGDEKFKSELSYMFIENIRELRGSLHGSIDQQEPDIFFKACHKVKVTLSMLDDKEFIELISELKEQVSAAAKNGQNPIVPERIK